MARLVDGQREAFEPLYRELAPRALRAVRARLGPDAAADVAQSSLEKVFFRASEFEVGRPVLPWFYAIVANEVRAHARKQRTPLPTVDTNADAPDAEGQLLARELREALERAIVSLDPVGQGAIRALLGEHPPDVPPATARKRVSRAVARLRTLLGGNHARG